MTQIMMKLAIELAARRIRQDIHKVDELIHYEHVIKLELWIKEKLNGLRITTAGCGSNAAETNEYYIKLDSNSIVPVAKHYQLYNDIKDALDRYYDDQCCIIL